ncbi:hypothetical protein C8Q70DRAFT_349033 [Cubamyces menziesii]|nr:hypothetical protein C8Q70DRAFT_349033 [Cubamyces menziesii]
MATMLTRFFTRLNLPPYDRVDAADALLDLKHERILSAEECSYVLDALLARARPWHSPVNCTLPREVLYPQGTSPPITPEEVLRLLQLPEEYECRRPEPRLKRVDGNMVVKFSYSSSIVAEGRTLLFIREHTSIPVPTVHTIFSVGKMFYLVRDYVPGEDLEHQWELLDSARRASVLDRIKGYLNELRNLSSPDATPGPQSDGLCQGPWFSVWGAGPFASSQDLVNFWNTLYAGAKDIKTTDGPFRADHPLVFVHGELLPRNFVLSSDTLYIVDWYKAGWYPEYVEYASVSHGGGAGAASDELPEDWKRGVLSLLPDYSREAAWLADLTTHAERWLANEEACKIVIASKKIVAPHTALYDKFGRYY